MCWTSSTGCSRPRPDTDPTSYSIDFGDITNLPDVKPEQAAAHYVMSLPDFWPVAFSSCGKGCYQMDEESAKNLLRNMSTVDAWMREAQKRMKR